jgi:ABC-type transport system involved in cytochrome bd biosynthesis fused ATPase/permease subunit
VSAETFRERLKRLRTGVVVVSPTLCRLLSVVVPIAGITLWPFILLAQKPDALTVSHEKIHIRQQAELLVIGFYVVYVSEWLLHRFRGKSADDAYNALRFEREAYLHENEPEYLTSRRWGAWRALPMG